MADPSLAAIGEPRRSNWVRLRTLIVLRWIAIGGQLAAITVADRMLDLSLELGWCYLAVGTSIISNLVATFVYPENRRLSEGETVALLLFDITQLVVLLFLTGGLHNPFALLILAPVTISATALQARSTILVGAVAILLITLIARWHIPLRTDLGFVMRMPQDFVFGFWVAIVIGILFLAAYARRVTSEVNAMAEALVATQMALAREQKLTDLGGVVAAAAHELGTPLATIKLVSSELLEELEDERLREDAVLIREQADRCRDILRSMGRAGKDDLHLRHAPVSSVVSEAAQPHETRGKSVFYDIAPLDGEDADQPVVARRPEIIHGVRNLIQNAVDFAETTVWIDIRWDRRQISLRITDDGPGFPPQVLPRIGDPFVRRRRDGSDTTSRPEYEGMGLGLFIAKTLLERTGAELSFANGMESGPGRRGGAIIEVVWPRAAIAQEAVEGRRALGQNQPIAG
ncbi:sensor histidine kinase RegB [Tranquillimonas alkanivorans]|uniref:histidine kinase n=1 Tax=Tranquillimonas alkanivorans TaxID=441119 RepID=A0A1I5LM18_9RHOB|nr:ActS/PrrB/RegB family redox-sensitive histidine kinase [Tranquillimonas alkanivorans]SFO98252.1 two-component system, sensor histidine kinase RegB [Tranquillimonas alkanivorans]